MNTKQWAVFLVALLSLEYVSAHYYGGYTGVPKVYDGDGKGYYGWSSGCRCNEELTSTLDDCLEGVQTKLGRYSKGVAVKDVNLEEYEFSKGSLSGFHKFERKSSYRCSLSRDYVRVYFHIRFVKIVIRYYVSLVEDILSGFLGGIGSLIGHILGKVSHLLCRIVLPDIYVTIVLNQRFGVDVGFEVEGIYLNKIVSISFLDKLFLRHQDKFSSFLRPACDHVVHNVLQDKISGVFNSHFRQVTAERSMFYYESEEQSNSVYEDQEDNDDE